MRDRQTDRQTDRHQTDRQTSDRPQTDALFKKIELHMAAARPLTPLCVHRTLAGLATAFGRQSLANGWVMDAVNEHTDFENPEHFR